MSIDKNVLDSIELEGYAMVWTHNGWSVLPYDEPYDDVVLNDRPIWWTDKLHYEPIEDEL